jgi:hypothetical protein
MSGDWEELTKEQQEALHAFRHKLSHLFISEADVFHIAHPELRLAWSVTIDAYLREKHPIIDLAAAVRQEAT